MRPFNKSNEETKTVTKKPAKRCTPAILAMLEASGMTKEEKILYIVSSYQIDSEKATELVTPKPILNHLKENVTPE